MSELVRMMARLMLAVLAGCVALTVGVWAAGRGQAAPPNMLTIAVWQPDKAIRIYWVDTQAERLIPYARIPFPASDFTWSPDGQLAFLRRVNNSQHEIYLVDGKLRAPKGLKLPGDELAWSPDGRLAFTSFQVDGGHRDISIREKDGQTQKIFTPYAYNSKPVWSSDGKLAFFTNNGFKTQIYILEQDGNLHPATNLSISPDTKLKWSPDGQLAFVAFRDDRPELDVVERDGTLRVISNDMKQYENFTWSLDGRLAFISGIGNLYSSKIQIWRPDGSLHDFPAPVRLGSAWIQWLTNGRLAFRQYSGGMNGGISVMEEDGRLHSLFNNPPDENIVSGTLASDGRRAYVSDEINNSDANKFTVYVLEPDNRLHHIGVTGSYADLQWIPFPFN
jgi:Tol biopolymer transport system component